MIGDHFDSGFSSRCFGHKRYIFYINTIHHRHPLQNKKKQFNLKLAKLTNKFVSRVYRCYVSADYAQSHNTKNNEKREKKH